MPSDLSEAKPPRPSRRRPSSRRSTSLETARSVARRLDRSVRTIDRYVASGFYPRR